MKRLMRVLRKLLLTYPWRGIKFLFKVVTYLPLKFLSWAEEKLWRSIFVTIAIGIAAVVSGLYVWNMANEVQGKLIEAGGGYPLEQMYSVTEPNCVSTHGIEVYCGNSMCPGLEDIDLATGLFVKEYSGTVYNYDIVMKVLSNTRVLFRVPTKCTSGYEGISYGWGGTKCAKGIQYELSDGSCGIEVATEGNEMSTLVHEILHCVERATGTHDSDHDNSIWERMKGLTEFVDWVFDVNSIIKMPEMERHID